MTVKIINAALVLPDGVIENGAVTLKDGIIHKIGKASVECDRVYDLEGGFLLPGFIDIHCHGGGGYDFMDATADEMRSISDFHLKNGTTTLVATTLTDTWESIEAALDTYASLGEDTRTLDGVHLEGPWFSPKQCGAQDTSSMEKPSAEKLRALKEKYPFIKRVSLAPEEDTDFAVGKEAARLGVITAIGHTDADFDMTEEAAKNGYSLVTHLYSGMRGVVRENAYRKAGCVEGTLYNDSLTAEVIADGKHLPSGLLKLIHKCKGKDRICLITDSTRGAGMPDGAEFMLGKKIGGTRAVIEDGVAKLPNRTSFAGSVATSYRLFKTMLELTDAPLSDISEMLSATPARVMGFNDRGKIAVGMRADLVALDKNYNIKEIFFKGKTVK